MTFSLEEQEEKDFKDHTKLELLEDIAHCRKGIEEQLKLKEKGEKIYKDTIELIEQKIAMLMDKIFQALDEVVK